MYRVLLALLAGCLCYSACTVPKEGCLDIAATNFDPTADEDCCCIYPVLTFSVDHLADTIRVHPDTLYHDIAGNPYQIKYFQFYISDIRLVRGDGSIERMTDSVTVAYANGQVTDTALLTDDFVLVTQNAFSFPAGTLRATGDFEKIMFRVGVAEPVLQSFPSWFEAGHPLAENTIAMWDTVNGYYSVRGGILRDTAQSGNISAIRLPAQLQSVELAFDHTFTAVEGFNTIIKLRVDYLAWLQSIQVLSDSELEIAQKLVNNTANAISIE